MAGKLDTIARTIGSLGKEISGATKFTTGYWKNKVKDVPQQKTNISLFRNSNKQLAALDKENF